MLHSDCRQSQGQMHIASVFFAYEKLEQEHPKLFLMVCIYYIPEAC